MISSSVPAEAPETPQTTTPLPAAAPGADLDAIKAELQSIRGQLADSERANEFWRGRDSARTEAPAPAAAEPEPEDIDVLDVLTTKNAKGLDEILAKRGFIRKSDVESLIDSKVNSTATRLTTEQELLKQYPDLGDKNSEFFKGTAMHYGELVRDGVPQAAAMKLAARNAELDAIKAGKTTSPAEREASRLSRIKAQGGESTRRQAETDETDDVLSEHEKHICQAMGISEESYMKRAKAGINMSSRSAAPVRK